MDARPRPAIRKQVEERDQLGLCLLCDSPAHKRGLCTKHEGRWRRARVKRPANQRLTFDAKQIREGRLLPSRQGIDPAIVNEFEVEA